MRSPARISAALLVTLIALSPHSAPAQSRPAQVIVTQAPAGECPVDFSARRQSITERVAIGDTAPRRASGQGVQVSLEHPRSDIRSAEVVVHAASNKPRTLPLSAPAPEGADLSRTFRLSGPATGSLRSTDLWLEGAGSILSVDLVSITYVDGSVWRQKPVATCRAIPSGLLLVSSR